MTLIRSWTAKVLLGAAIATLVLATDLVDVPFKHTVGALVIGGITIIFGVVLASVGIWQWVFQGVDRESASDVVAPDVLSLRRTIPGVLYATVAHAALVVLSIVMHDAPAIRVAIPMWVAVVGVFAWGRGLPTFQQRCAVFTSFAPMVATMTLAMADLLYAYFLIVMPGVSIWSAMGVSAEFTLLLAIGVVVATGPMCARIGAFFTPRLSVSLSLAGVAVGVAATMYFLRL